MEKDCGAGGAIHDHSAQIHIRTSPRGRIAVIVGAVLAAVWLIWARLDWSGNGRVSFRIPAKTGLENVQQCAIDNLHKDLCFLEPAKPIETGEFIARRDKLAQALAASETDAFVVEPGYTFQYA